MKSVQLSKRLNEVAKFVTLGARLADIGSDHAYLPCVLVKKGIVSFAIAGEVALGPFQRARQEVLSRGLKEQIEVRLGNGLEVLEKEDRIDTLTLCGMGGILIQHILAEGKEKGKLSGSEKLILQPNVDEEWLRNYLQNNGYRITAESIIEEKGKWYEIISAEAASIPTAYSRKQLRYGPFLLNEKTKPFIEKWEQKRKKLLTIKEQLKESNQNHTEKIERISYQIQEIEEWMK